MKCLKNILILLLVPFLFSCKKEIKNSCCVKKDITSQVVDLKPSEMSVYNLNSIWKNQLNEEKKLSSFVGKTQILAMVYTKCTYACPRIVADLKKIEEELEKSGNKNYGLLLISMDPTNDTPEKLMEFSVKNKFNLNKWQLLTGADKDVLELAAVLNVKYKKETSGEISHSNILTVLDPTGEILFQQEGLGVNPDQVIKVVKDQQKNL